MLKGRTWIGLATVAVMIGFAGNSVITRYLVQDEGVDPFALTVLRFLSGAVALMIMAISLPGSFPKEKLARKDIIPSIFLGTYAFSISYGYVYISASVGTFVFYIFVVITMSALAIMGNEERVSSRFIAGSVLGLIGVGVISMGDITSVSAQGVILMAVTGASWGAYSVSAKRYQSYFSYSFNTFMIFGIFAGLFAVASLPFTGTSAWASIRPADLLLAVFMGSITTALVYVLWSLVMKKIRSMQGGVAQLLVPVFTAAMAVVILNEEVTIYILTGGFLVLLGIYLNAFRRSMKRSDSREES